MSSSNGPAGPQFRADRPVEQESVRTTIVGGRPPGSGQPIGKIPRGIEVLVKKAAVDAEFRAALLERRAAAAEQIGLTLEPAEAMMLAVAPAEQLQAIIARTSVPGEHRRAFLGQAAAAMLAALVVAVPNIATAQGGRPGEDLPDGGIRPGSDLPEGGIRPELPERVIPQDLPEGGTRPIMPPPKPDAKAKTVQQRVIAVVAKQMNLDAGGLAMSEKEWLLVDLDATSTGKTAQRKALEKEFQLKIPKDAFQKLRNVRDAVHYVQKAVEQRELGERLRKAMTPNRDHPLEDSAGGIRPDLPK